MERLELKQLLAQLDLLQAQKDETDQLIATLALEDNRVPRLMQVTGISYFTAFAALAVIGDIARFPSAKHLTAYAGLVPSLHQSGQKLFNGHITKTGSSQLRWLMVEAARSAMRFDPHWQAVAAPLKRRRGTNIAAVAIARKLLVVIWHLLQDEATYYHLRPQSFARKLQEWAWKIGSQNLSANGSVAFVKQRLHVVGLSQLAAHIKTAKGRLVYACSPDDLASTPAAVSSPA